MRAVTDAYSQGPDSLMHIDVVHRTGRAHRGVWLFVVDAEERVLLVHRSGRMARGLSLAAVSDCSLDVQYDLVCFDTAKITTL